MVRILVLLLTVSLSVGFATGFIILTKEIIAGNLKISDGQKQLAEGEKLLAQGKAKLASGRQRLSRAKDSYNKMKAVPFAFAAILPVAGQALVITDKIASEKIAEGDRLVAQGARRIRSGEKQLADGRAQLNLGIKKLNKAKEIRIALAVGSIFFMFLTIVLVIHWRRSLFRFGKRR